MVSGRKNTKRHLGGTIFGLVFLLPVIAFLVIGILPNLYDWIRMRSWEPVPARLVSSNLETHHGSDATTYKVVGAYQYSYEGEEYTGRCIGISGTADNAGGWHRDTYYALKQKPLRVWVNADNPSEAVFDRELRLSMLGLKMVFVVVLGLVGGVIVWAAGRVTKEAPPGVLLWRWDPHWRENRIRSDAKGSTVVLWGFAIIWNTLNGTSLLFVPKELSKGNYGILVVFLSTAVGLGLIYFAIKKTLEWRRVGVLELNMDPFPGHIGGDVGGTIELPLPTEPNCALNAQLTCTHIYTKRSGSDSGTERDVVWQDDQPVKLEPFMRGSRAYFCFQVPDGLPKSGSAGSDYHEWKLSLSGEMSGVTLDCNFAIPVFIVSTPARSCSSVGQASDQDPVLSQQIAENILRLRPMADGLELYYSAFRSAHLAVELLLIGGVSTGIGLYLLFAEERNALAGFILGFFSFSGLLPMLIGFYKLGNTLKVHASPNGLQLERRIYGFSFKSMVPISDIQDVEKHIGWQEHNGAKSKAMYQLQARKKSGATINLGDSLPNASSADQILTSLRLALSLSHDSNEGLVGETLAASSCPESGQPSMEPSAKTRNRWLPVVIKVVVSLFIFVLIVQSYLGIDLLEFFNSG